MLAEAVQVVADVGGASIRLIWLDRAIKKIHEGKELQHQHKKIASLNKKVNEAEQSVP